MIQLLSPVRCPGALVGGDSYIPLTVSWPVPWEALLYLWVADPENGYVELNVDWVTGAVHQLVIIDLPRRSSRRLDASVAGEMRSPTLDLGLWPTFTRAPDIVEGSVDLQLEMTCSQWDDWTAVWFSEVPVTGVVDAGDARVGVSANGELVVVAARRPGGVSRGRGFRLARRPLAGRALTDPPPRPERSARSSAPAA